MRFKKLLFIFTCLYCTHLIAADRVIKSDYRIINPPVPITSGDKIEVVEVFWYGCPHCYQFEPFLESWLENIPEDVEFIRIPGVLGGNWIPHAKAFYAAEQLGVLEQIHRPLFDAIHKQGEHLSNEKQLGIFFEKYGVDKSDFNNAFNSEETEKKIKEAYLRGKGFKLTGVPTVIINGKYTTSASQAGGHENVIKVINNLIEKERLIK